jgi:uncharacterized protein YbjT (DUF2867 family)
MAKSILVVGATGVVGTAVVEELVKAGHDVRAATRDPAKLRGGGTGVRLDLAAPSTYAPALDGVDAVFLLSPAGHADSHGFVGPFLKAALSRARKIVTMTAAGVEYDDAVPLRKIELDVVRSGVPHVLLRPSWFDQNFHTYWHAGIAQAGVIAVPAADARTTFIDARDIGAAAAAVLQTDAYDGEAFTLTGPEALTYAEAAEHLSAAGGRRIRYTPIDDATFARATIAAGLPQDYTTILTALFGFVRQGAASRVDPSLARLLGRAPRTLADYARDHAQFFRA